MLSLICMHKLPVYRRDVIFDISVRGKCARIRVRHTLIYLIYLCDNMLKQCININNAAALLSELL